MALKLTEKSVSHWCPLCGTGCDVLFWTEDRLVCQRCSCETLSQRIDWMRRVEDFIPAALVLFMVVASFMLACLARMIIEQVG